MKFTTKEFVLGLLLFVVLGAIYGVVKTEAEERERDRPVDVRILTPIEISILPDLRDGADVLNPNGDSAARLRAIGRYLREGWESGGKK
jgi:hypothetical protein